MSNAVKKLRMEELQYESNKKTLLMVVLLLTVCGCLSVSKQASAKTVSKVTKAFTLTPKKNFIKHKLSIKKKVKVVAKMKFLEVKGKVLVSNEDYISGRSIIEWYIPKGIKKLKVQVTYYTKNGKAAIMSVK